MEEPGWVSLWISQKGYLQILTIYVLSYYWRLQEFALWFPLKTGNACSKAPPAQSLSSLGKGKFVPVPRVISHNLDLCKLNCWCSLFGQDHWIESRKEARIRRLMLPCSWLNNTTTHLSYVYTLFWVVSFKVCTSLFLMKAVNLASASYFPAARDCINNLKCQAIAANYFGYFHGHTVIYAW